MSRIGKNPIVIVDGVTVSIKDDVVNVSGKNGKLDLTIPLNIKVEIKDKAILVSRENELKQTKSIHGTIRMLIFNMVTGVSVGFKKELDIVGVGFKSQIKGTTLVLNVGFSHVVEMVPPAGVKASTTIATHIVIEGIDKQKVGEFAAKIRAVYPPEPYKGKGIRYTGEEVRKKLGKALAK